MSSLAEASPLAAPKVAAPAALIAAVEAAVQALAGRSAEFERLRCLPADVPQQLAELGLYRLLTPAAYGGHELAPRPFFTLIERLAQGDAAAAWCCFISCTSSLLAAWLPQDQARTLFASPTLKAAGVFAPRGRAVPAEQAGVAGVRVSGRWAWGSGSDHADLISAGCLLVGDDGQPQRLADGAPRVLSVLLRADQVRLLHNWHSMGLQGSGSGEFEVDEVFVPWGHTASLFDAPVLSTPLYRFPVFGLLALAIAAVACGVARQALDVFIQQVALAPPGAGGKPLAARATVQDAVARAEAQLRSARAWLLDCVDSAWAAAQSAPAADRAGGLEPPAEADAARGHPAPPSVSTPATALPLALRRDLRLAATHAVHSSAAVVDRVFTLAGGGAVFDSSPLQRCLRNVHVATQHMMVAEATWELGGRLLLGQPAQVAAL